MPAQPLLPGDGVGNDLAWSDLQGAAPKGAAAMERAAWDALAGYLEAHQAAFGIDVGWRAVE